MNNWQKSTIREVEKAMLELHKSGLALAGIDSDLVVFSYAQFKKRVKDTHLGPAEVINDLDYETIECPYLDSGGT